MGVSKVLLAALSVVSVTLWRIASASIYPVENQYWVPPFQHAEKMFASDKGPVLSRTGNSSVAVCMRWLARCIVSVYTCEGFILAHFTCTYYSVLYDAE